jgi:hypothetical protein
VDTQGIERLIFGLKDSGLEPLGDGCTSRCEFHQIRKKAAKIRHQYQQIHDKVIKKMKVV